jgi:Flp pilus assembly pilin Flp
MKNLFLKLWADDAGIVALEYLLVATIVGLGLVVGLAAVNSAMTSELTELANAILSLNQDYSFTGKTLVTTNGNEARRAGSAATNDLTQVESVTNLAPYRPGNINVAP